MDIATIVVNSSAAAFTRYIASNPIPIYGSGTNHVHNSSSNSSTAYQYPLFYFGPYEFNGTTYYHRNIANVNNESEYHYSSCPSIQMPVGSLISMILYAIVCIVGLFGNTLVIYVVLRFSKMQTVTNMYILNLAIADEAFLIGTYTNEVRISILLLFACHRCRAIVTY